MVEEIMNAAEPQEEPAAEVEPQEEPVEPESGTDWKAQARKWEKRAKKSEAAQRALEEEMEGYKASFSTELEDMRGRAERAESRVSELQAEADRQTAIKELSALEGVPVELLEHFATPEEMEAFTADWKKTSSQNKIRAVAPANFGGGSHSRIVKDPPDFRSPGERFAEWARNTGQL